jgi:hypothetical protein
LHPNRTRSRADSAIKSARADIQGRKW